jgi:YcaO cyclodehydratase, ATP-ad Mg2+-binding
MTTVPPPNAALQSPQEVLGDLLCRCPLPLGSSAPELFTQVVEIGACELHLVGLVASIAGEIYSGSAAEQGHAPLERAYFELVERLSIGKAINSDEKFALRSGTGELLGQLSTEQVFPVNPEPERWRYAKSNGVAVAPTWAAACERAAAEAVERDCVLRSWYRGMPLGASPFAQFPEYAESWRAWEPHFSLEVRATQWLGFWVVASVGFPKTSDCPFMLSFGARRSLSEAIEAARREFEQRLGFLFGEEIPSEEPPSKPGPGFHQEYSLWSGARDGYHHWLAHTESHGAIPTPAEAPLGYVDLTPAELTPYVRVARAWWPSLLPLVFGTDYPGYPKGAPHPVA